MRYSSLEDRIIANTCLSPDSFYAGSPCWLWLGATVVNNGGRRYGKLDVRLKDGCGGRKTWLVHRLVLVLFKGRRLTRRSVGQHLCNNTLCCNPEHLIGGSQSLNIRQCVEEGRHFSPFRHDDA